MSVGFFASKGDNSRRESKTFNDYVRDIDKLSAQVSNLVAVRPTDAGKMAAKTLKECAEMIKAVAHQQQGASLSNRTAVDVKPVVEERERHVMSIS